jgi:hypothetical protein
MLVLKWPTFNIFDAGLKTVWESKGLGCSRGFGPEHRGLMGFYPSKCVSCNYFIIEMYSVFISVLRVAFCKPEAASQVNTNIRVSTPALRMYFIYLSTCVFLLVMRMTFAATCHYSCVCKQNQVTCGMWSFYYVVVNLRGQLCSSSWSLTAARHVFVTASEAVFKVWHFVAYLCWADCNKACCIQAASQRAQSWLGIALYEVSLTSERSDQCQRFHTQLEEKLSQHSSRYSGMHFQLHH